MFDSTDEAFISKISPSTACICESESTKRIFKFSLKFKLTEREKEIIKHILDQKSNQEIAEELDISKRTVETHRKNIMLKMDVKNSIGIAVKCIENNILQTS